MRDVARYKRQQLAERIVDHGFMKRGVAHAGADAQRLAIVRDLVEPRDLVDVDEMRGLGQPKRHDRHQALAAGQHAAVFARDLAQNLQRLIERARHVANERRWLHAANRFGRGLNNCTQTIKRRPRIVKPAAARTHEPFPGAGDQ